MAKTTTKQKTQDAELFNAPPTAEQAATGKAVAKHEPKKKTVAITEERVVPMTGLAEILGVFERLAINPDVNPDSLDKLLAVQERLIDRNAALAFNQAFVAMTPNLPLIRKEGRIVVREKDAQGKRTGDMTQNTPYPKWETTGEQIKPVLAQFGFGLGHRIGSIVESGERRVRVTAVLRHVGGHVDDSCYFDLPADATGSKNNNQAWASSVTYAKRHTAFAVLGLITEGDDDDAKKSGGPVMVGDPLTEEELDKIITFATACMCGEPTLVKHLNKTKPAGHPDIKKIADLPRSRFDETILALQGYDANRRARDPEPKKADETQPR
jgi:hypothetical protein